MKYVFLLFSLLQFPFHIPVVATLLVIVFSLARYFYKTREMNKQLKLSNQIKDKLFCIIGHDLSNPIGGITKLLAIMEEDENIGIDELRQMISVIRKQGDASLEILTSLLSWGETQLKGIHINPVNFLVRPLINKNLKALQKHIADKSLEILNHIPSDLMVFADADHFDFIIRNLASNAIKFSFPLGKIEITADFASIGGQVVFSVKDNGKGISTAQQEQFLSANMDVEFGTKGEKGTGIGLTICKEFIKAGGGKIWIKSEEGKGTGVSFTTPTSTVSI